MKQESKDILALTNLGAAQAALQSVAASSDAAIAQTVSSGTANLKFRPCGYGLEVDREGNVRHIGKTKLRKPQCKQTRRCRITAYFEGKMYYPPLSMLVAKAWLPDYYEGCKAIWLDGDVGNNRSDNLKVVSEKEFKHWNAVRKHQRESDQLGYWLPTGVDDIECTQDGRFRREGIVKIPQYKVTNGAKQSARVFYSFGGQRHYYTASHLIARAWHKTRWYEGCCVTYKDGDKHNIHADNLEIVDEDVYNRWISARSHASYKQITIQGEIEKIENIIEECQLSLNFLRTGDFAEYNSWVGKTLVPRLTLYCRSKGMSLSLTRHIVPEAVTWLYELLDCNRGVFGATMICKKAIESYLSNGEMVRKRLPKKIEREYNKIDYSCLVEKFRKR